MLGIADEGLLVACGEGVLAVRELQRAGKRPISARDFANAVALVESNLEPPEMLRSLKSLERDFGRRAAKRWSARVLDLDLVLWSGGKFRSRALTVPHPRLKERDFVLRPLATIAPGWRIEGSLNARHLGHRLARAAPRG